MQFSLNLFDSHKSSYTQMNYERFKEKLVKWLEKDIPDPKEIIIKQITGINGCIYEDLFIQKNGCSMIPLLNLHDYCNKCGTKDFWDIYSLK